MSYGDLKITSSHWGKIRDCSQSYNYNNIFNVSYSSKSNWIIPNTVFTQI
jgi:hypothetical protein